MKIILKYIITSVKERKLQTGVMLLSILLSTTLLFVSFSIGASHESAQRKMVRGMERLYGAVFGNEGRLAARNMRDNRSRFCGAGANYGWSGKASPPLCL